MNSAIEYTKSHRQAYLADLTEYLALPSISSDPEHKQDMFACAEYTVGLLKSAGISNAQVSGTDGHPVVTGGWMEAPGKPTVLIYGHYDVQPVDPLDLWEKPPFEAHVHDDRVFARGSADDKGQLLMHIKAIEAIQKSTGSLPINIKVVFEGEEEIGSPNLPKYLAEHREELSADVAVVSDVRMWAEGVPAITYGLRGLTFLELELTGPNRDLHSGSFGGVVANPAEILARMLAKVKNDKGRIQIPGFYDDVTSLEEFERDLLAKVPFDESEYKAGLGVEALWGEEPFSPLELTWARPTFEINGIWGGFTGVGAKTVLPAKASAKVSMRLVPDQDPDKIAELTEAFFREITPPSVLLKITRFHGGKPVVVPLDNPYMLAAARSLKDCFGREPLFIREGGSIPIIADFKDILGIDTLLVGFALPDAKAHSPNENLHLPTFYTGIESLIRMYYYISEQA